MSAYTGTVTAKRSLGGLVWFAIVAFLIGLAIAAALAVQKTAPATTGTKTEFSTGTWARPHGLRPGSIGRSTGDHAGQAEPQKPIVVNGKICHQCVG